MIKWQKVLILLEDNELKDKLVSELQSMSDSFNFINDPTDLEETLIISDEKNLEPHFLKDYSNSLFLITQSDDHKNVSEYLFPYSLNHLFGANARKLIEEIKNTLNKNTTNLLWGVEHYLENDAKILNNEIQHSDDIQNQINEAIEKFDFSSFFTSPAEYIKVMANELLTNAFYNISDKPVDRSEDVSFSKDQKVLFQIGMDKNYLIISVKDNYGILDRDGVVKSIERGLREKTVQFKEGGAGIGLYLTFSHSNQMIVNQNPGIGTEVICIIDTNRRFKHYKERITSFHYHTEG